MEQSAESALDSARERFVEGLSRRADELRAAIAQLAADPQGRAAREGITRRLQALLANAQLFELSALAERVAPVLTQLGEPGTRPPLTDEDFADFNDLVVELLRLADRPRVMPSGIHKVVDTAVNDARDARDARDAGDNEHSPTSISQVSELAEVRSAHTESSPPAAAELQARLSQADTELQVLLSQAEQLTAAEPGLPASSEPAVASLQVSLTQTETEALVALSDPTQERVAAASRQAEAALARALGESDAFDASATLTQSESDSAVVLTQTVPGLLASPLRAKLLLVCSRPHALRFQELLEDAPLQISHAADAEEAIRLLHGVNPSCVLLSAEFASLPDIDLIRRMQTDPLSKLGAAYVILPEGASYDASFVQQTGADGVLVEPLDAAELVELVQQSVRRGAATARNLRGLSSGTVDDIAHHVAEEIRRGIADSLRAGQHEHISLGNSQELMAAAWSAIGRVRSHLAEQSRGRVSFRDDAARELPSFMASDRRVADPVLNALAGKRVLVADDDPAVLWFFSGMLREASAHVLQAQNGREALELARRKQPHLVLSDILMPKIDGFALCRELKRDALLAHVPVILLSWKDDLLERMRELDAGASGYVRKEAGSSEIMTAIADVLRPHTELVAALRADSEVLGRVEPFGVIGLLETVALQRPDARITVQDAWNLFEVELRSGQRLSVTRTAADGSFARADRALLQLLGVRAGRFSVHDSSTSLRSPLAESLHQALQSAGKTLCATLDAVSDTRLVHVALLAFEEDVVELLQSCTPTRLHEVVTHFRVSGATAKDLLFDGSFTPAELEGHLRELARCGAISGVWNAQGDDLVAAARKARQDQPGVLLHSSNPPNPARTSFSSAGPVNASAAEPGADAGSGFAQRDAPPSAAALSGPTDQPWPADEYTEPDLAPPSAVMEPSVSIDPVRALRSGPQIFFETARLLFTLSALVAIGYLGWQRVEPYTRLGLDSRENSAAHHMGAAGARAHAALVQATPSGVVHGAAPATARGAPSAVVQVAAPAQQPQQQQGVPLETAVRSGTDPDLTLGRILPYIDQSRGVTVGPEQGLLVLEYTGSAPAPSVRISGRELGRPPLAIAVDAGRQELVVHQDRESSFRYLIVRAGETRVITLPL